MLKVLLLGQWHGLSDPALEDALADRISFRRFCGYALDERTPDDTTLFRFCEALQRQDLAEGVFAEINRQIDASLVEAAVKRPKPPAEDVEDGADADETAEERPASRLVRSAVDPEAAWSKKGGRRYFGYKAHVGVDQGSGIIRRQCLTPGNINDTVPADDLECGDEAAVYADAAYDKKARRRTLKQKSIKPQIMFRANMHHALTPRQEDYNKAVGHRRAPVKQVFAKLKRLCGWSRVRYIGLACNAVHLALLCTALNLKRLTVLMPT